VDTDIYGTSSSSSAKFTIAPQYGFDFGRFAVSGQTAISIDRGYFAARVSFPVWSK